MTKENKSGPDIAAGEPFAFRLKNEEYNEKIYVCVPGSVCDNPSCSCKDLGMAIYEYPAAGKDISAPPLYAFVLDLENRSLQEDYPANKESQDFGAAFLDHTTREHWPLYERAFVTLKEQAVRQKTLLKGSPESVAGQLVSLDQRKTGRNDPCLCGSGKKYKNCCGK